MYEREAAIKNIITNIIIIVLLFIFPLIMDGLTTINVTTKDSTVIESTEYAEKEIENIMDSTIDGTMDSTMVNTMATSLNQFSNMFKTISRVLIFIMILSIIVNFMKLVISNDCHIFSDNDGCANPTYGSKQEDLSSINLLNIKGKEVLNEEVINLAFLNSNKNISKDDLEFMMKSIEKKVDWYSYKKENTKITPSEKMFNTLLLNVLLDYNIVKEFFFDEVNKSENININITGSFEEYIENENNYFKIRNKYYLKELVFYALTNNEIKVSELYKFMNDKIDRKNITYTISLFIEEELSFNDVYSLTDTLEEAVADFNNNYDLDLSVGLAKNLIYLSKVVSGKDNYVVNNTPLLDEMKQFKTFLYK